MSADIIIQIPRSQQLWKISIINENSWENLRHFSKLHSKFVKAGYSFHLLTVGILCSVREMEARTNGTTGIPFSLSKLEFKFIVIWKSKISECHKVTEFVKNHTCNFQKKFLKLKKWSLLHTFGPLKLILKYLGVVMMRTLPKTLGITPFFEFQKYFSKNMTFVL